MKTYAYLAVLGAITVLLYAAFHYGQLSEREKVTAAVLKYQDKEAKLIEEIQKAGERREVVYRDRIKVVRDTKGVCIGSTIDQPLLDSLRHDVPSG